MHLQVLSSGSQGNSTLVRCGELAILIDAGLPARAMRDRLDAARTPRYAIGHVFVTHGHLDHARSAAIIARRERAVLHCSEAVMQNRSFRRARELSAIRIDRPTILDGGTAAERVEVTPVLIPHDARPTVAYRVGYEGRVAVVLTDMGRPDAQVARRLGGAHVLVLEFNHDTEMLETGPYSPALRRRIRGVGGHLSNEQAAEMLKHLAGPNLHTLILAHLSEHNNQPELAMNAARTTLRELALQDVSVLVASQHDVGPNLAV